MRDDEDVSALFVAVDAYLRGSGTPGRRIVAEDGRVDFALPYHARHCLDCYDRRPRPER